MSDLKRWCAALCVLVGLSCGSQGDKADPASNVIEPAAAATDLVVSLTLPPTVSPSTPAVAANDELRVDDRVELNDTAMGTAVSTNAGGQTSEYGADAHVRSSAPTLKAKKWSSRIAPKRSLPTLMGT